MTDAVRMALYVVLLKFLRLLDDRGFLFGSSAKMALEFITCCLDLVQIVTDCFAFCCFLGGGGGQRGTKDGELLEDGLGRERLIS